jgi:hypothetical protein
MANITIKTKTVQAKGRPDALILSGLQAPARTIQSKRKVQSKRGARKNKWGRFDD